MTPAHATGAGWFELVICLQGDSLVLINPTLVLYEEGRSSSPRFIPLSFAKEGLRVIFHALGSIQRLSLRLSHEAMSVVQLSLDIRKRNPIYAQWSIMRFISQRDRVHGIDPSRIYRKSHVRYKKHGYAGYLQRLLKEYHLADTHVSSEEDLYQAWIVRNEAAVTAESRQQRLEALAWRPCISVVMASWRSDLRWLEAAIRSVKSQSYPHWELCIADDASCMPELVRLLEQEQALDSRLKLVFRPINGHISAAQNSALELAVGEYVTFLDHDDLLARDALLHVVEALQVTPRPRFLYSDEDKIDGLGRRVSPHFKSDWNPDLLLSQNYITHLMVAEHALVQEVGAFREGLDGSQDHDLALRLTERLTPAAIVHIPHILYHWRITADSTALHADAKTYTEEASLKALRDRFERLGQHGVTVETGALLNTYRVHYPLPQPAPLVSLLIPTRDELKVLEQCIASILAKTDYRNYEILILDNGSVEAKTLTYLEHIQALLPNVRVLRYDHPFNYSAINNFGAAHAKGSILGLINNDIEVINPDWLSEMVSHACRDEIGCVGAKLYFPDGTIQHAGVILGVGGVAGHAHKHFAGDAHGYFSRLRLVQNLSAVTGACLVVRKAVYEQVGGLNEEHLKVAFNDVDFCLKVRADGYRNLWTPYAELFHHESKSRGHEDTPEKQARFQREVAWMLATWGEQLQHDPYYNPNLTLDNGGFSLSLYRTQHTALMGFSTQPEQNLVEAL
ncbi:MAG: glycosyltransferase [Halothiobacillaceae bacterium]|nr:glycosyltransferase [Halothiobacillaceae bacterium]